MEITRLRNHRFAVNPHETTVLERWETAGYSKLMRADAMLAKADLDGEKKRRNGLQIAS